MKTVDVFIEEGERVVIVCCPSCSTENIISAIDYRLHKNGSFILDTHYGEECEQCYTAFILKTKNKPCFIKQGFDLSYIYSLY